MKVSSGRKKVFVAGHRGLVGSALVRGLEKRGDCEILTRNRTELDLLNQGAVRRFFEMERPHQVYVAAARVGGIHANNTYPADFLYENLMIAANVIHSAAEFGSEKLLFLGSSCIYPKHTPQPMKEEALLSGPLEPTNEGYSVAKIAGLKLCEMYQRQYKKRFISAMPTNLYGPFDNYHPENSHVIPMLLRRFHEAKIRGDKEVVVWGTGKPMREFLHADDLAEGLILLMDKYEDPTTINVGTGIDCTIAELAQTVKEVVGFSGTLRFDPSRLDGTPRKLLDVSRIQALGWKAKTPLREGLKSAYQWAVENKKI